VYMRVMKKVLAPGVKNAEEPDLRAEVFRIRGHFKQRGSAGAKQKAVEQFLVVIGECSQFVRQGEDHIT